MRMSRVEVKHNGCVRARGRGAYHSHRASRSASNDCQSLNATTMTFFKCVYIYLQLQPQRCAPTTGQFEVAMASCAGTLPRSVRNDGRCVRFFLPLKFHIYARQSIILRAPLAVNASKLASKDRMRCFERKHPGGLGSHPVLPAACQ